MLDLNPIKDTAHKITELELRNISSSIDFNVGINLRIALL